MGIFKRVLGRSKDEVTDPSRTDLEDMIDIFLFFVGITDALEGDPVLLGKAKGYSQSVLAELTQRYRKERGRKATKALFKKLAKSYGPNTEKYLNDVCKVESIHQNERERTEVKA